jgi:ACS family pantothenate transporter-like MFS transporter
MVSLVLAGNNLLHIRISLHLPFNYNRWRWMFLFDALITVILAALGYRFLPDYPHNTTWLNRAEKELAVKRLGSDNSAQAQRESTSNKMEKIKGLLGNKYLYPFIVSWAVVHISLGAPHVLGIVCKKIGFDAVTANLLTTVSLPL